MVPDEPDLLRHVTQLDVRDNRLTDLDASVFPRLEVLHCERNRIAGLKAKGCLLKGIYASNNGRFCQMGCHVLCKRVWLEMTGPTTILPVSKLKSTNPSSLNLSCITPLTDVTHFLFLL